MSKNLLHISRQLKVILQKNATLEQSLKDINLEVKCSTDCNIIILDKTGNIITNDYDDQSMEIIKESPSKSEEKIISQFNDQLQNIIDTRENITFSNFYIKNIISDELANLNTTIIPLLGSSGRIGTVVLYKKDQFTDEQIVIAEFSSIIVGLLIMHFLDEEEAIETRRANIMRSAISTLSYSELEAIIHIVDELDGTEGLLIASKVADKVGITRSVIVNALRKLESAGILESRSLGMKGTYIKISNDLLLTEISKLKK